MAVTKEAVTKCITRLRLTRMFPNSAETITALGEVLVEEFTSDRELAEMTSEALTKDSWCGLGFIMDTASRFRYERMIAADLEAVIQARAEHEKQCSGFDETGEPCHEYFESPGGFGAHAVTCRRGGRE